MALSAGEEMRGIVEGLATLLAMCVLALAYWAVGEITDWHPMGVVVALIGIGLAIIWRIAKLNG